MPNAVTGGTWVREGTKIVLYVGSSKVTEIDNNGNIRTIGTFEEGASL